MKGSGNNRYTDRTTNDKETIGSHSYFALKFLYFYIAETSLLSPAKQLLPELNDLKNWETTSITSSEDRRRK